MRRGEASLDELKKLNPYVEIKLIEKAFTDFESDQSVLDFLRNFSTVIITDLNDYSLLIKLNTFCRENSIKYLQSDIYGLFGYSFTDFGARFEVLDADGEEYKSVFIHALRVSNERQAFVEAIDQKPHNLEPNDHVKLSELKMAKETCDAESLLALLNENVFIVT